MKIRNKKGFTLAELMIVVVIIGILAAVAIPTILSWLPNMRLRAAARDLYSNIQGAKVEAMKNTVNSALTFNQNVGGTIFVYIIYADANANCEYDAGETIFTQVRTWPEGVSFDPAQGGGDGLTFTPNDDGNPTIVFLPTTIPTANGGGVANGTAFLKNTKNRTRAVVINNTGRVNIN